MKKRLSVLCMIAGLLAGSMAHAADPKWYVGLSAGNVSSNISAAQFDTVTSMILAGAGLNVQAPGATTTLDDSDTGWSILGGFRFTRHIAIEASYVDLGDVSYRYNGVAGRLGGTRIPPLPVTFLPVTSSIDVANSGFSLAGVGTLPLGERFDLHANLGVLVSTTKVSSSGQGASGTFSDSVSATTQSPFFGVGAAMRFGDRWSASLDWQRFNDLGVDEGDIDEWEGFLDADTKADYDAFMLTLRLGF